ncbi:hypothetical protein Q8W71_03945 [Methylobacterium sp. NEAU 140]|uniref:DUF6414 family protein n=1 Tax=Methylobacterium sp. NEAU 140 TaxID=3064945 RepID=UPI0027372070|nr:hypothetical protein [Methylobacterium sp. NEAU 140]MDP4021768.1 hypothetical protein [Methylobacterium sp. NEAU 140]
MTSDENWTTFGARKRMPVDMSTRDERVSEREQDGLPGRSVYDFLYSDNKRIGSFLSQFDDNGLLEKLTQIEGASKNVTRGYKFSIGGGATVVGTGGTGTIGIERGPGEQGTESLQRVYDPLWTNALTLLDFLMLEDLINKDIKAARIGQFVLLRGRLSIFDMNALKGLWNIPTVKDNLIAGQVQQQEAAHIASGRPVSNAERRQLAASWKAEATKQMSFNLDVLNILPHSILCSINDDGHFAWCSLMSDSLVTTSSDLLIKYGVNVAGDWAMLAVLDALPSNEADAAGDLEALATDAMSLGGLGAGVAAMAPVVRAVLGRPAGAFGVTPLMIFRQVASQDS